jgi:O-antigen ligase/Tfp pilus assembly protein PilF
VFISLSAGLLALFNIPMFFFRYYESSIYGFDDFSQFRFLYRPLSFLSNEWVTISLCLLPFPFISLLLLWKNTLMRSVFVFIIGLLILNILISFSRAGILAFLSFVLLLNIFIYVNRLFSIKKLFFSNIALITLLVIFAYCFSDSIQSSVQQTQSHQRSTDGRLRQWRQTIDVINSSPYFGLGSKNYALLGRSLQKEDLEYSFTGRVNNSYLQLLIEKGWIGFLLWLCVIGVLVLYSFQQFKKEKDKLEKLIDSVIFSAICAVLFREFFFSSLFYNSGLLLLFFMLFVFNHKEAVRGAAVQKSIVIGAIVLISSGAIYFYFRKPDSALFYAAKGLSCERNLNFRISHSLLESCNNSLIDTQQDSLMQAIQFYRKACQLSPADAMFQHNLGWLYQINQQPDSAIIYLSQAIKLEPNVALYHISRGLIEESLNLEKAFNLYRQAILLSPDIIDSQFFMNLRGRYPVEADGLLRSASDKLSERLSIQYSSILEAKNGKILLALGDIERAYQAFSHVTQIHPNLNRPWYYWGLIEYKKGSFDRMQICYKKSLFLSPFDHLPLYAFAGYYEEIEEKEISGSYYKAAEKAWENKRSSHSSQCKRMYFEDTEKDDVIPNGFLDYITPVFQLQVYDQD